MVILVIIVFIIAFSILSTSMESISMRIFSLRLRNIDGRPEQLGNEFPKSFRFSMNFAWAFLLLTGLIFVITGFYVTDVFIERFFLILSAIIVPFAIGRNFSDNLEPKVLQRGFEQVFGSVLKSGRNVDVENLLREGLAVEDPEFKAFLVEVVMEWGGPSASVLLAEAIRDADLPPDLRQPHWLQEAKEGKEVIDKANAAVEKGDAAVFEELSADYLFYQRLGKLTFRSSPEELDVFLEGLKGGKERYPFHVMQRDLIEAHPDILCEKCRSRGEIRENEHYGVVFCRQCGRSEHLMGGIKQVVGILGEGEDWDLKNGTLQVQLWDREFKKVRFAEVDSIRFNGLNAKEAEWAIAGVLESFRNEYPPHKLPVLLENDPPSGISSNSTHQLEGFGSRSKHPNLISD